MIFFFSSSQPARPLLVTQPETTHKTNNYEIPSMDDIKASYDRNNLNRVEYPLHEIGQMEDPIEIRLAWAEEAIAAGNDPNELDIYGGLSSGLDRPLHCAVSGGGPPENLQLVRFLLDRGADPRLRDARNRLTPMWLAELWSKGDEKLSSNYYPEALKMMKAAAKKLDGESKPPPTYLPTYLLEKSLEANSAVLFPLAKTRKQ